MDFEKYTTLIEEVKRKGARLVAVSKTKPPAEILTLYDRGQTLFGENKVQELVQKYEQLPKDIAWHLIGHLQTNKVKFIAPFVSMIQSVDSMKLLAEIDKQAAKQERTIDCLLQIYIADEETKFGLSQTEAEEMLCSSQFTSLSHVHVCGLMGMATNTEEEEQIRREFRSLKTFFEKLKRTYFKENPFFCELSMGMSADYKIALEEGATLIRVGSKLFGEREYL